MELVGCGHVPDDEADGTAVVRAAASTSLDDDTK